MEKKKRGRPAKPKAEEVKPIVAENKSIRVYIIGKCPNPVWLRAMKEDQSRCSVRVPKASIADRLVGKWVEATKIDESEENLYNFVA